VARRRGALASRFPRRGAAMPTVLVTELAERPSLEARHSPSASVHHAASLTGSLALERGALSDDQLEVVEEVLLRSDVGVATTALILDDLRVNGAPDGVATAVRATLLDSLSAERTLTTSARPSRAGVALRGVNGVGKTTTIGKLAKRLIDEGAASCWPPRHVSSGRGRSTRTVATRTGLTSFVRPRRGPRIVVHDALGRAAARGADIVLADTAGRRSNSTNLLDELSKVRRVAIASPGGRGDLHGARRDDGQNALSQAESSSRRRRDGHRAHQTRRTARGGSSSPSNATSVSRSSSSESVKVSKT